jgi:hypothetical protein
LILLNKHDIFRRSSYEIALRADSGDCDSLGRAIFFWKKPLKVLFRRKKRFTFALPFGQKFRDD